MEHSGYMADRQKQRERSGGRREEQELKDKQVRWGSSAKVQNSFLKPPKIQRAEKPFMWA